MNPDVKSFPRIGTPKRVKSKDWVDNREMPLDMIAITIRAVHTLFTDFNNYAQFPFDTQNFLFRFEISHFAIEFKRKKIEYRFDFYE